MEYIPQPLQFHVRVVEYIPQLFENVVGVVEYAPQLLQEFLFCPPKVGGLIIIIHFYMILYNDIIL